MVNPNDVNFNLLESLIEENKKKDDELQKIVRERKIEDCERQIRVIFTRLGIAKNVVFDNGKPKIA